MALLLEDSDSDALTISLPPPLPLLPAYRAGDSRSAPYPPIYLRKPPVHPAPSSISACLPGSESPLPSPSLHTHYNLHLDRYVSAGFHSRLKGADGTRTLATPLELSASKSSPQRSPSASPHVLETHVEEACAGEVEDKRYSPSDELGGGRMLSTSFASTTSPSVTLSAVSLSPASLTVALPSSLSSGTTSVLFSPLPARSHSALSASVPHPSHSPLSLDALSSHVNPFFTRAAYVPHRSLGPRGRSLTARRGRWEHKEDDLGEAVRPLSFAASTASTDSAASSETQSSSSSSSSSSSWSQWAVACAARDAEVSDDSDMEDDAAEALDHAQCAATVRSARTLRRVTTASFTSPASAPSLAGSAPLSPFFDSSLNGSRHSADPSLSAGIGVFAAQLATIKRLRSVTSPQPGTSQSNAH